MLCRLPALCAVTAGAHLVSWGEARHRSCWAAAICFDSWCLLIGSCLIIHWAIRRQCPCMPVISYMHLHRQTIDTFSMSMIDLSLMVSCARHASTGFADGMLQKMAGRLCVCVWEKNNA